MLRRIQMSSQGGRWVCGPLLLALGLTVSCSSGHDQNSPAIYAAAIGEIQSYLTMEVQHGPYAAAAAYLAADEQAPVGADTTWPVPDADAQTPVLIAGEVYSYESWSWTSADQFTLLVTLDLHFRGDPGRANWREGHNNQFVAFSRPTPQTRWLMHFATGP